MAKQDLVKRGGVATTFTAHSKVDIDVSGGDQALDPPARALRCLPVSGAAGVIAFTDLSGVDQTTEIAVGETFEIGAVAILQTGTTATGLEALQ